MAGVVLLARAWKANHMASKVPKGLGSVAISAGYNIGIKRGYCSCTAIRTTSKTISVPGAKTRSVPVATDTTVPVATDPTMRNSRLKSQKGILPTTPSVRLRWVWHQYPSAGLPVMYALVVAHLCSCVEIGDSRCIPFLNDGRLSWGSFLALKPLVSHLRYASQVTPIRSQHLCPRNYRPHQGYSRQYNYIEVTYLSYHPVRKYNEHLGFDIIKHQLHFRTEWMVKALRAHGFVPSRGFPQACTRTALSRSFRHRLGPVLAAPTKCASEPVACLAWS